MPIPLRQDLRIGAYLLRQQIMRREKYPLIVELEPLFACNLACPGCGKIQHPTDILRKRLSADDIIGAMEESGAPMCSIAGGGQRHTQVGRALRNIQEGALRDGRKAQAAFRGRPGALRLI